MESAHEIVDGFAIDGVDGYLIDEIPGSGEDQVDVEEHHEQVQIEEVEESHANKAEGYYLNDPKADIVNGGKYAHIEA